MELINLTQKDYSIRSSFYQLKLPINIEYKIPEDDSVRLLGQVIEEMDLKELYQTYSRIRKNQATPRQMLKVMLYAYMNNYYSSRKIETSCKRDINFMYLLEGAPAPDYSTIARFRSLHFAPVSEKIMAQMTDFLAENKELSLENLFIDGTKLEAVANKQKFCTNIRQSLEPLMNKGFNTYIFVS
jgi:transposase